MKVIVSQYGSRRRYMIPQILESNGMLAGLYTDSTSESLFGRIAHFVCKHIKSVTSLQRLTRRKTGVPSYKVHTHDGLQIKLLVNRLLKKPVINDVETIFEGSASHFISCGIPKADWLYTMFIENYEFASFAKKRGIKILADIYENPYIWRELESELEKDAYRCIGQLKEFYVSQAILREKYLDRLLETADQYLVPSEYVKNCIKRSANYSEDKVNVIPYASSVKNKSYSNKPVKGRIIWIGNDPIRKGLCYCAEAATKLTNLGYDIDFRIIGKLPSEFATDNFYKNLNFKGYCNKEQLEEEFIKADMFVFPTLAEGFAGVLLEAASFGVPIITTDASGFSSDAPCIFVEKKNSDIIVDAIIKVIEDRDFRNSLSKQTFDYSQSLCPNSFEKELINLLESK